MKCRLCNSENLTIAGQKTGRYRPLIFTYYCCRNCSFVFVDPCLGSAVYNDDYYQGKGADPLVNYQAEYLDYSRTSRIYEFLDILRIVQVHLSQFKNDHLDDELPWLDFGCGAGGLLKFLREKQAVDLEGGTKRIIPTGFDVGVYADRLASVDKFKIWGWDELNRLPDSSFGIITCIEVVEHLEDPMPIFRLLARLLKKRGLLLLTTGNLASPVARVMRLRFPYCVPEIHVGYFNPELLAKIYEMNRLSPVRAQFHESLRFKFRKNLPKLVPEKLADRISRSAILLRALDALYGVSTMPCATKI